MARAVEYMQKHFPWAQDATVASAPSGELGDWQISWHKNAGGLGAPMRLDIVVDAEGKIASFAARDVPKLPLPPARLDAAAGAVTSSRGASS